ncbi:MAG: tyrosine-type recombinase/integrase [Candidatus Deferrimicrobiaceae bacterium]
MTTIHVYDRNARNPGRKPNWWLRYSVKGEDIREPGKATKRATHEFAALVRRQIDSGRWVHPRQRKKGLHLFEVYAHEVIERRRKRGVKTWRDEQTHVEMHLAKMFAGVRLDDMTFRVIREAFDNYAEQRAGRTIRNIHATLRAVLLEAAEDELIPSVPPPLTARRGHLPAPKDIDPDWRRTAVFSREEVASLIGCEAVPVFRRVLYCTLFLTGARIGEVLAAKVRDYDASATPLPSITYVAEKTARAKGPQVRIVPVHPVLRAWLGWWLATGFELTHGQRPKPGDLLFRTASERRRAAGHVETSQAEISKQWTRNDLPAAGLRHRRIHDSRRTFISVSRSRGQDAAMVRSITHKAIADVVLDSYTSFEWDALCEEVQRVDWGVPGPPGDGAEVVPIKRRRAR